jgi:hypothetical protein
MCRIPTWEWTVIWLSDSHNWVCQVCDSLSELIRTHGGSRGEYTVSWSDRNYLGTRPEILASTCKAFGFWLCEPQGERMKWRWTGQAIRYAPGM